MISTTFTTTSKGFPKKGSQPSEPEKVADTQKKPAKKAEPQSAEEV